MVERLLLDAMLGKLATYLRICGHDAAYALDRGVEDDDCLRELAGSEGRRLLTRDVELAARTRGSVLLESRDVEDQLRELRRAGVDLTPSERPMRCGACNGPVTALEPQRPVPEYAPDPAATDIWRCRDCGQHFWKGSHWDAVVETLAALAD